jgi:ribosome-associated protein
MKKNDLRAQVAIAVRACQEKKAADITILQLDEQSSGFTDYFIICTGTNPRQLQAIADEVDKNLSGLGNEPSHTEGYNQGEWVLLDYVDFVVHIFSEGARKFYDLERLWKTAKRLDLADLEKPEPRKVAERKAAPPAAKPIRAGKKAAKSPVRKAARSGARSAARKPAATRRKRKKS